MLYKKDHKNKQSKFKYMQDRAAKLREKNDILDHKMYIVQRQSLIEAIIVSHASGLDLPC